VSSPFQVVVILPSHQRDEQEALSPCDRAALAQALALQASQVTVVSAGGPDDDTATLEAGLVLGAHRAVHLRSACPLDYLGAAILIARFLERERSHLVLCADECTDIGSGSVGPAVAGLCDHTHASGVVAVERRGDEIRVTRRDAHESEELVLELGALLCVCSELAGEPSEPASATPAIETILAEDLLAGDFELQTRAFVADHAHTRPNPRAAEILSDVRDLFQRLEQDEVW
jgi:electron transfer flavoprotein alpha/beta subunit